MLSPRGRQYGLAVCPIVSTNGATAMRSFYQYAASLAMMDNCRINKGNRSKLWWHVARILQALMGKEEVS